MRHQDALRTAQQTLESQRLLGAAHSDVMVQLEECAPFRPAPQTCIVLVRPAQQATKSLLQWLQAKSCCRTSFC